MVIFFIYAIFISLVIIFVTRTIKGIKQDFRESKVLSKKYGFDTYSRGQGFWIFNPDVIRLKKENPKFKKDLEVFMKNNIRRRMEYMIGFFVIGFSFLTLSIIFGF